MRQLFLLIKNDFIKLSNYKPYQYLVLGTVMVFTITVFVTFNKATLQSFKFEIIENLFTAFFLGQYLFICVLGLIITNLIPVFLMRLELEGNSWKYIFSLPVSPSLILYSKLLTSFLSNFILVAVMFLLIAFEGLFLFMISQEQTFYGYINSLFILNILLIKFLLLSFSATSMHFLLVLIFGSQTLSIILSFIMPIVCLFDYLKKIPYGWPFTNFWFIITTKDISWNQLIGSYELLSFLVILMTTVLIFYLTNRTINKLIFFK